MHGHPWYYTSDYQLGATLQQLQGERLVPCGYFSRTMNSAERNYSAPGKECLAVVWAILHLRPYLERTRFTVSSDQVALRWLLYLKDLSGRLARWRLRLAEFDFEIQYRPGIENSVADGCSRVPTTGGDMADVDDDIPCFVVSHLSPSLSSTVPLPITIEEIQRSQHEDPDCQHFFEASTKASSHFLMHSFADTDVLCRSFPVDGSIQIVVPLSLRS
jgi:hypothetical protein